MRYHTLAHSLFCVHYADLLVKISNRATQFTWFWFDFHITALVSVWGSDSRMWKLYRGDETLTVHRWLCYVEIFPGDPVGCACWDPGYTSFFHVCWKSWIGQERRSGRAFQLLCYCTRFLHKPLTRCLPGVRTSLAASQACCTWRCCMLQGIMKRWWERYPLPAFSHEIQFSCKN